MNKPPVISPMKYFLSFLTSVDFLLEHMYPLRYLVDKPMDVSPDSLPPRMQAAYLLRRALLNLSQFSTGERSDIYRWSIEDTGRLWQLPFADAKERGGSAARKLETLVGMAINQAEDADVAKYVEIMFKELEARTLFQ